MNKFILLLLITLIDSTLVVNATTKLTKSRLEFEVKPRLIIALQDNHPITGTDSSTTTYPNTGMNTMPTHDTGTETNAEETPMPEMTKPPAPANQEPIPPPSPSNMTNTDNTTNSDVNTAQ